MTLTFRSVDKLKKQQGTHWEGKHARHHTWCNLGRRNPSKPRNQKETAHSGCMNIHVTRLLRGHNYGAHNVGVQVSSQSCEGLECALELTPATAIIDVDGSRTKKSTGLVFKTRSVSVCSETCRTTYSIVIRPYGLIYKTQKERRGYQ